MTTKRAVLKAGDLIFDLPAKDSIHLYFSKQDSGLSSPIDISIPKAVDEDQVRITSFLFTCIERIQQLGTMRSPILHILGLEPCILTYLPYFYRDKARDS